MKMSTTTEPLLTREQVAELLQMSVSWVKGQIRKGRLRQTKLGKIVRIEPGDLREFIYEYRASCRGENVGTPRIPGLFGPDTEKTQASGFKRG